MSGTIGIIEALLGEHGVLYEWLDAVESTLAPEGAGTSAELTADEIAGLARRMSAVLGSHARLENELLLDEVARRGAEEGPLAVMRREHDEIETLIDDALSEARTHGDAARVADLLLEAIAVAREHFEKEELAAFPMAERALDPETLKTLGARWAEQRGVLLER